MSCTRGDSPGAETIGEGASVPPGAFCGRVPPVTLFHGHMVSASRCPIGLALLLLNEATIAGSKRLFCFCHFAHSRSTLQWSRKNSGSLGAVAGFWITPPKLTCADPCGLPSMGARNCAYEVPSANVCASVRSPGGAAAVLKSGRRLTPGWPSVFQNCSGLLLANETVPRLSDTPMKSGLKIFGAAWSKRQ